ncbi:dehydrogenase [Loigolactobacillus coryniformis subsp. coryniformis]|uniref:Oxidoreductase n=2 Tax=Loigolactobacillus coryniformis TaxID=1610 RepID=A0A0R1F5C7_9LACO|nr:zinc-binding dehydrogenase [Loigolactobacillus coryniformis]OEH90883.1 dehydrogenase [Loigolactobacillus coryniformis subsp. coryniformis]ATO44423.1 dehydrogenase [Loigolactobacillus coryniformis subsp. torquens DSM 20004 = KCTC 3535]ATO56122.1 dehydrogenase [Loigolactobacillus coryniformis subsp. coryniformis KCTC 3167 = DSM 20001]KRK14282.1 oxidoreductase [Loigolactobacillus coryniformis subsp. coryniformis KCTC 3167 = DSM 20001]KRK84865.1 oxidoreductase [Loigolactobacillus coryniformis s
MQAAYIKRTGAPTEIQLGELPMPYVASHDVLIKVKAVAVDHVDTFIRGGSFKTQLTFPFIIGRDAVGTVVAVGNAVDQFKKGDLVWTNSMGYAGRQGVTSEYAAIPVARVFKVPAAVNPLQLVAAVHSGATAAILLADIFQVRPGATLLVEGAAGHVGRKLIQLAHDMGLTVITTSQPCDFAQLTKLGSAAPYDYQTDFTVEIADKYPQGIDYIVDTSGRVALQANLDLLAQRGTVALITAPATDQFDFRVREFYTTDKNIAGFVISHATLSQLQQAAKTLNHEFSRGRLLEDKLAVNAFAYAAQAHQLLTAGSSKDKIILVPTADEID